MTRPPLHGTVTNEWRAPTTPDPLRAARDVLLRAMQDAHIYARDRQRIEDAAYGMVRAAIATDPAPSVPGCTCTFPEAPRWAQHKLDCPQFALAPLDVEALTEALDAPGVFEDPPDDAPGLARDIAREYAAILATDTAPLDVELRRIEWVQPYSNSVPSCPACGSYDKPNHRLGCWLAVRLAKERDQG